MEYSTDRKLRSRRRETNGRAPSRSSHTADVIDTIDEDPLIDPNVIDPASQRIFLVSFFILIQCWKIYDVVLLKTGVEKSVAAGLLPLNSFTFVLKYAVAEGLFLWILPILNVPLLSFSPFKTLLLTFILNGYTFILASDTTLPILSGIVLPIWNSLNKKKELTLIGDSVTSQSAIDMSSHFKGRYTINYLPDSSAKFNPFKFEKLCLTVDPNTPYSLPLEYPYIPIEFNTTNQLGSLEIQHIDPSNKVSYINYTSSDLHKLTKKDYSHLSQFIPKACKQDERVFYIEIPLKVPGSYKIHSVKDSKGISIRTYKTNVIISNCPSAQFMYPKDANVYKSSSCIPSSRASTQDLNLDFPLVRGFGVTPLTLKFSTSMNGKKYKEFSVVLDDADDKKPSKFSTSDLGWLKSHSISRNSIEQELLSNPIIVNDGTLEFHLSEIIDSLGHSIRYNPSSKDQEIFYSVEFRKEPIILMEEHEAGQLLLINNTKTLYLNSKSLQYSDFPLRVDFSYENGENALSAYNFTKVFADFNDLKNGFEVGKEGVYSLVSGKGKICPCQIDSEKRRVEIKLAPLPSIDIKAEPIVDKCVGMTGYQFEFDFTGKPPFQLQYQVFQKQNNGMIKPLQGDNGLTVRYIKSFESKHEFVYKPPKEGTYLVVFKNLRDMNYQRQPVLLEEAKHTYETYFKQRSRASFSKDGRSQHRIINSCLNKALTVPLFLKGNPPFSFTYSIIEKETQKKLVDSVVVKDVDSDVYEIQTPNMSFGGEFQVVLDNLKDNLSCDVDFDKTREVFTIKTRKDIPKISFIPKYKNAEVKLVEGDSLRIPLELISSTGTSHNDKLEYSITDLNDSGKVRTYTLQNINSFFVKEEGIYSLKSFSNGECSGEVPQTKETVKVTFYDRPSLEVFGVKDNVVSHIDSSIQLKSVCQGCKTGIELKLKGVAPFVIDYDIVLPNGKVESRTMTIEEDSLKIDLPTTQSGRYIHNFKNVYDNHYTREKTHKSRSKTAGILTSLTYDINGLPNAYFSKEKFVQICESKISPDEPIAEVPINYVGSYPFSIDLSLTHEQTGKVDKIHIKDVSESVLRIKELHDTMSIGNHVLTIDKIVDSNGCVQEEFSPLNNFFISITEVPNISKMPFKNSTKPYYCVGDHIKYNMSGFPPFTVYYEFNHHQQKAELSPSIFQRLASKAGNLSITALSDSSANQCLVNFTTDANKLEDLKLRIYDLPSVEINQGDYIVEDIHEGDQTEIVFTFEGVPPFTLTYIRTIEVKNRKGETLHTKVMEKKTVKDIWEYEYTVRASLEGTYEAIELSDAYCVAKRDVQY